MKKKLMAVALATIIAVMAVAGASLAWLKDTTAPVVNTFTEGKVDIDLYEHDYDPETNKLNTDDTAKVIKNDDYKMVPGKVLPKDPTVDVIAGSEACWLFVKIEEINNVDTFLDYSYITGDNGWTLLSKSTVNGIPTIIIYRQVSAEKASAGESYQILVDNKVSVKTGVVMTDMNSIATKGQPQLKFTAYAIQSDYITATTPEAAWALIGTN